VENEFYEESTRLLAEIGKLLLEYSRAGNDDLLIVATVMLREIRDEIV